MKTYRISFSAESKKFLRKLDRRLQLRIVAKMETLETDPRPRAAKKLVGRNGWRLRVDDYRVIYTIEDDRLLIMIVRVGHRKEIYR